MNHADLTYFVVPANLEYVCLDIPFVQLQSFVGQPIQSIGTLQIRLAAVVISQGFYRDTNRLFGQILNPQLLD